MELVAVGGQRLKSRPIQFLEEAGTAARALAEGLVIQRL
jgi:hypothetical protein